MIYQLCLLKLLQSPGGTTTIGSKLLSREEFWYKELGSIYPYGLNYNVKQLGNVSKKNWTWLIYLLHV